MQPFKRRPAGTIEIIISCTFAASRAKRGYESFVREPTRISRSFAAPNIQLGPLWTGRNTSEAVGNLAYAKIDRKFLYLGIFTPFFYIVVLLIYVKLHLSLRQGKGLKLKLINQFLKG